MSAIIDPSEAQNSFTDEQSCVPRLSEGWRACAAADIQSRRAAGKNPAGLACSALPYQRTKAKQRATPFGAKCVNGSRERKRPWDWVVFARYKSARGEGVLKGCACGFGLPTEQVASLTRVVVTTVRRRVVAGVRGAGSWEQTQVRSERGLDLMVRRMTRHRLTALATKAPAYSSKTFTVRGDTTGRSDS